MKKSGGMLIELAPAIGTKVYDWKAKSMFFLDVTECGQILDRVAQNEGTEFLHDPNMGGEQAGQIIKRLKLQPMQDNKGNDESFYHV